jgi:hypothetical protein
MSQPFSITFKRANGLLEYGGFPFDFQLHDDSLKGITIFTSMTRHSLS